jgi:hypothetical protein
MGTRGAVNDSRARQLPPVAATPIPESFRSKHCHPQPIEAIQNDSVVPIGLLHPELVHLSLQQLHTVSGGCPLLHSRPDQRPSIARKGVTILILPPRRGAGGVQPSRLVNPSQQ